MMLWQTLHRNLLVNVCWVQQYGCGIIVVVCLHASVAIETIQLEMKFWLHTTTICTLLALICIEHDTSSVRADYKVNVSYSTSVNRTFLPPQMFDHTIVKSKLIPPSPEKVLVIFNEWWFPFRCLLWLNESNVHFEHANQKNVSPLRRTVFCNQLLLLQLLLLPHYSMCVKHYNHSPWYTQ